MPPDPVKRDVLSDRWEPRAGEMHPVDEAFYKLAIKDRDYERTRVNSLMAENKRWLGLVRDLRAENERLSSALETAIDCMPHHVDQLTVRAIAAGESRGAVDEGQAS